MACSAYSAVFCAASCHLKTWLKSVKLYSRSLFSSIFALELQGGCATHLLAITRIITCLITKRTFLA